MTGAQSEIIQKARKHLTIALQDMVQMDSEMIEAGIAEAEVCFLSRGEYFCQSHFVCHKLAFVVDGLLRSYYLNQGEEITLYLIGKNQVATSLSSFISGKTGIENVQAITDCTLLQISREALNGLYDRYPVWERLGRKMTEDSFLRLEDRMISQLVRSAEDRYLHWFEKHREIVKDVPLQYVASLLGMKPETLSRIRKKLSEETNS